MLHQVLRRFSAEGQLLKVGDLVETSHWKNERLLLEHRFIGKPSTPPQQTAKANENEKVKFEPVSPERSAAIPEELPRALKPMPRPSKPVPVVGRVPVAKESEE